MEGLAWDQSTERILLSRLLLFLILILSFMLAAPVLFSAIKSRTNGHSFG